jgi:hypothetical protein
VVDGSTRLTIQHDKLGLTERVCGVLIICKFLRDNIKMDVSILYVDRIQLTRGVLMADLCESRNRSLDFL